MTYHVGIDLGGTNIVAGVVDEDNKILEKVSRKTNLPRAAEGIMDDMIAVTKEAVEKSGLSMDQIESIGVGSPGIADIETGYIEYANNLQFYHVPMGDYIGKILNKPVYVANDANAAAYGEYLAGAGKGANHVVCITLGTGVGGGVVINGKLLTGFNHAGGELGHIVIEVDGAQCTCGRKGCFEAYASATALVRMTEEAMDATPDSKMWEMSKEDGKVSARLAFNAMRAGDAAAKGVVDKYIKYLSSGIASVINVFMPEIVCLGGGVCNEGDPLLLPVRELVAKEVYTSNLSSFKKNTQIVIAQLGNDAGIIGAAKLR